MDSTLLLMSCTKTPSLLSPPHHPNPSCSFKSLSRISQLPRLFSGPKPGNRLVMKVDDRMDRGILIPEDVKSLSEEEEEELVEELECLEEEAIAGDDEGREPTDYDRRARIFFESSRVFQALKEKSDHDQPTGTAKD